MTIFTCYKNNYYQFKTLNEAAVWAYQEMLDKPSNCSDIVFKFRIIDTEEDIFFSFGKKDGKILRQMGWMTIDGWA